MLKLIFLALQELAFPRKSCFSFAEIHPPAETSVRLAETRLPSEVSFSGSLLVLGYLKLKLQPKQKRSRAVGGGGGKLAVAHPHGVVAQAFGHGFGHEYGAVLAAGAADTDHEHVYAGLAGIFG